MLFALSLARALVLSCVCGRGGVQVSRSRVARFRFRFVNRLRRALMRCEAFEIESLLHCLVNALLGFDTHFGQQKPPPPTRVQSSFKAPGEQIETRMISIEQVEVVVV